jgi:hypothetical protein
MLIVMAGHSRSKNGVLKTLRPGHPRLNVLQCGKGVDARHEAGHDGVLSSHRRFGNPKRYKPLNQL